MTSATSRTLGSVTGPVVLIVVFVALLYHGAYALGELTLSELVVHERQRAHPRGRTQIANEFSFLFIGRDDSSHGWIGHRVVTCALSL